MGPSPRCDEVEDGHVDLVEAAGDLEVERLDHANGEKWNDDGVVVGLRLPR
jgi:hypothetical protein